MEGGKERGKQGKKDGGKEGWKVEVMEGWKKSEERRRGGREGQRAEWRQRDEGDVRV